MKGRNEGERMEIEIKKGRGRGKERFRRGERGESCKAVSASRGFS